MLEGLREVPLPVWEDPGGSSCAPATSCAHRSSCGGSGGVIRRVRPALFTPTSRSANCCERVTSSRCIRRMVVAVVAKWKRQKTMKNNQARATADAECLREGVGPFRVEDQDCAGQRQAKVGEAIRCRAAQSDDMHREEQQQRKQGNLRTSHGYDLREGVSISQRMLMASTSRWPLAME